MSSAKVMDWGTSFLTSVFLSAFMQLCWPYFTLRLAGTRSLPPIHQHWLTLPLSHLFAFFSPDLTVRYKSSWFFLISTTSWDSLAEAKRFFLVCDQCFPASTSRFNQDIISPPGETRAGVPSSFHFPAFTFCLTLFPSTHPFPEVLGCYWSLPCERSLPARGWRETVWCFQKKKKRCLTEALWCKMKGKAREKQMVEMSATSSEIYTAVKSKYGLHMVLNVLFSVLSDEEEILTPENKGIWRWIQKAKVWNFSLCSHYAAITPHLVVQGCPISNPPKNSEAYQTNNFFFYKVTWWRIGVESSLRPHFPFPCVLEKHFWIRVGGCLSEALSVLQRGLDQKQS